MSSPWLTFESRVLKIQDEESSKDIYGEVNSSACMGCNVWCVVLSDYPARDKA